MEKRGKILKIEYARNKMEKPKEVNWKKRYDDNNPKVGDRIRIREDNPVEVMIALNINSDNAETIISEIVEEGNETYYYTKDWICSALRNEFEVIKK